MRQQQPTTKMGRPPKVSFDTKKDIVSRYFLFEANSDSSRMRAHNIFALLAEYSALLGRPLKAYDFSKDANVRAYIESFQTNNGLSKNETFSVPAYVAFDIKTAAYMEREKLYVALTEREQYFQTVYKKGTVAIESFCALNEQIASIQRISEQKSTLADELTIKLKENKKKCVALDTENRYLKSYIRHHVEPNEAEAFLKGTGSELSRGSLEHTPTTIASFSSYTKDDKAMEADAEEQSHFAILKLFEFEGE